MSVRELVNEQAEDEGAEVGDETSIAIEVWRRPRGFSVDNAVAFGARVASLLDEFGIEVIARQAGPGAMPASRHLDALANAERRNESAAPTPTRSTDD